MSHLKKCTVVLSGAALLVLLGSGCVRGVGTVLEAREAGEGTAKVYPVTSDQAWDISRSVFRWERADAIEEHRPEGYMLTTIGENYVSKGSVCGAWLKKLDDRNTEVTVISRRRIATNMATGMTEARFHTLFERGVRLVQAGKPLPLSTPPSQ